MNPQGQTAGAASATETQSAVSPDLLRQIVEEMETANPYGFGKYEDADATILGLPSLGSLRLAHRLAREWTNTAYIPKWIAESKNPIGTFVATVVRGNELGFKMMESLSALYLSPDGRLGLMGTAMLSLMRKSKVKIKFKTLSDDEGEFGIEVYGMRDDGDDYTASFTHEDAVTAGLWDKNQSIHKKYPQWMCKWRAVSDLFRSLCSDLAGGPIYTAEELRSDAGVTERGDSSDRVFQEEGKRQSEEDNPYTVGRKAAAEPPKAETKSAAAEPEPVKAETKTPAAETKLSVTETKVPVAEENPKLDKQPQPPPPVDVPKAEPAKPAAKAKISIKDRLRVVTDLMPGVSPDSLVNKTFAEYLRGFCNISKLPPEHSLYDIAIRFLEANIKANRREIERDPQGLGVVSGAGWGAFCRFIDGWPADCKDMAGSVALERFADSGGNDLMEYFQKTAHTETMNVPELRTFMEVLKIGNIAPMKLRLLSDGSDRSMTAIVLSWGLDLKTATEAQVLDRLSKEKPTSSAMPTPPVPQEIAQATDGDEPADDDEELGNLFSGLPEE